jgi:hypothetical protein
MEPGETMERLIQLTSMRGGFVDAKGYSLPVSGAPTVMVELALFDNGVVAWSSLQCRRIVGSWLECFTFERVVVRPTHWRPSEVRCASHHVPLTSKPNPSDHS